MPKRQKTVTNEANFLNPQMTQIDADGEKDKPTVQELVRPCLARRSTVVEALVPRAYERQAVGTRFMVCFRRRTPLKCARAPDLRCPVTLKVISEKYLGDESTRLRFLREARAAASLRHSNVASVLHLGRTGSSYFYAMRFVAGETLRISSDARPP